MSLVSRFTPLFDELGAGAARREAERVLPYEEIERLRAAGFTRVTLPERHGGDGASHSEFFELLTELARRDPNLAQLFRSHFSYIDRAIHAPAGDERETRLARLSGGAIVGNASHERSAAKVGSLDTKLVRSDDGLRLTGTKFYSTGTLFADLVGVAAEHDGELVSVLVPTDATGVSRIDDWTGFGQRLTGSGTTIFDAVAVQPHQVSGREPDRPSHGGAFVQLVLLATITGIGRAIVDDATRFVRARTRAYSHGSASTVQQDPIVQEVVGELSARSFAADSALAAAVLALQRASESGDDPELVAQAELATARAQLVVLPNVLEAATSLFDVGGASAVDTSLALDRHWRNARTVASHNPSRYKARAIGDRLINDTPIVSWWSTGEA